MTRRSDLEAIRRMLERRRDALSRTQRGVGVELDGLRDSDRDPEFEESAQVAQAEFTLSALHETRRSEIAQVDAALSRLDAGSYGICVECELEIPSPRLAAVPYSLRCAECATQQEYQDATWSGAAI